MNIGIISQSLDFRNKLDCILNNIDENIQVKEIASIEVLKDNIDLIKQIDILFVNSECNRKHRIQAMKEIKLKNNNIKILIKNNQTLSTEESRSYKIKVEAYLSKYATNEELEFAVRQVISGRKYYDPILMDILFNKDEIEGSMSKLTCREREVARAICKGLNNKEISIKLHITEHTVKKHISNILSKLELRDRKDIIINLS